MGLGPSTKLTTLHHYQCPLTRRLLGEQDIDFCGVIVHGVAERYDDKIETAKRTGALAEALGLDGAIVAIDGWGNHHVDFVEVLRELGERQIPTIALSYIGLQGRLVCTNPYVGTILDVNKHACGYESCVVGDNTITDDDARKAVGLLRYKMGLPAQARPVQGPETIRQRLGIAAYPISAIPWGEVTAFAENTLYIRRDIGAKHTYDENLISAVTVQLIPPDQHHRLVHSNLDFFPIAAKEEGSLGEGITRLLQHVTVMVTGVDTAGIEPSNIGSSAGYLDEHVQFDQGGTPKATDYILHIHVTFCRGMSTSARAIRAAHAVADTIVQDIREALLARPDRPQQCTIYEDASRPFAPHVGLVKIVSALGAMYETTLYPEEPGGFIHSRCLLDEGYGPIVLGATEVLDGAIHSLL